MYIILNITIDIYVKKIRNISSYNKYINKIKNG